MQCPTIEIGFYGNSVNPELFTLADSNAGSMFNANKMTMKIHHIYASSVLDHRAFYRDSQPGRVSLTARSPEYVGSHGGRGRKVAKASSTNCRPASPVPVN